MSINYRKKDGYPCDLTLEAARRGSCIFVKIDGVDRPDLSISAKEPYQGRRAFAKGFFAGIKHAEDVEMRRDQELLCKNTAVFERRKQP